MPKVEIPITSLQIADEEGVMVLPEVGDAVSFTIEGSVESLGDEYATVGMETVNGEPAYPEEEVTEESVEVEAPSRDEMIATMQELDQAQGL
jgi:hypothetical protein